MVAGEAIETGFPADGLVNLPLEGGRNLRTKVGQRVSMFVGFHTKAGGQGPTVYIAVVDGQGREVDGSGKLLVEPVDLVIHTETYVEVKGRHEIGEGFHVVGLKTARELGIGKYLKGVVPILGGLQSHLSSITDEVFVSFELMDGVRA